MRHFLGFVQNIHQINPHDSNGKQGDTEKCQQYEHQGSPAFHGNTVEEIADQEKIPSATLTRKLQMPRSRTKSSGNAEWEVIS